MRGIITTAIFCCASYYFVSAEAQTVSVSKADCSLLVKHIPSSDVAYQPGIDANGRKVVSADLGGQPQITVPTEFSIPITVDLQKLLGLPANPNQFQTQNFSVGTVTVKEGKVYFNGKPLQNEQAAKLSEFCQRR
ncbi:MAG: hypothetical protein CMM52_09065 [Rhodospirillaceae bacterium]|nr:hypothetical protein [Rhodospirillaceae bacterium]|tara:strand:- start:242 stop:646 length:405 start_codon:yes stop_codon:yes gene_type:complete